MDRRVAGALGVVAGLAHTQVTQATQLSPEVDVGHRIEWSAPQFERSLTFDGCRLVVLAKQRREVADDMSGIGVDRVYASRVSLSGEVRDPRGVPVDLESAIGFSNGSEVITITTGPGSFGMPADSRSVFARLGTDLTLLGRRVLDPPSELPSAVECKNGECLLLGQSLKTRLVDFTGATRSEGLVSHENAGWQSGPLVAVTAGGYFVAFTDEVKDGITGLYVTEVSTASAGNVAPRLVREIPGKPLQALALAQASSGFLVVAQEWPDPLPSNLGKLVAIRTDGTAPIELASDSHDYEVDAFGAEDRFVVAFRRRKFGMDPPGPTMVARIAPSGVVDVRPETRGMGPAVSTPLGRFVLDESLDLHHVAEDGSEPDAPIAGMRTHFPVWNPVLVPGAGGFLLTYQDRDSTQNAWRAIRITPDGAPIDSEAPPVFTRPVDSSLFVVSSTAKLQAAFDGASFVLGWIDDAGDLELVHEDPATGVRDVPVGFGQVNADFRIHSGARGILVTWSEGQSCGEDCFQARLLGAPVDRSGRALLAAPAVLVDWSHDLGEVGPGAFDGTRWVVPRMSRGQLDLATITEAGVVGQTTPWRDDTSPFSSTVVSTRHPRTAWSGSEHLVVFEREHKDLTTSISTFEIRAIRLDESLAAIDAELFPVAPPGAISMSPEVVFDGARFVVAWRQAWPGLSESDLAMTFVSRDGAVQTDDCFLASKPRAGGMRPTLAALPQSSSTGSGAVLIGYDRLDPDPALVSSRVKLRVISAPGGEPAPRCTAPEPVEPSSAPFEPEGCSPIEDARGKGITTGGCGCEVPSRRQADWTGAAAMLAMVMLGRARRRRSSDEPLRRTRST